MKRLEVVAALNHIRKARHDWGVAQSTFNSDVEHLMTRLLNEAAVNFMSAEDVARASGLTIKRVRVMMRQRNLNPKDGKRLLAKRAATTLEDNAALLGIEPRDMDLMSPLAYLPAGGELQRAVRANLVSGVTEFPETDLVFNDVLRSAMDYVKAIEALEASGYTVTSP